MDSTRPTRGWTTETRPGGGSRVWRTVLVVLGWQLSASVCYYGLFAATPFLRDAFGLSRFMVGLAVAALTLGQILLLLPAGAAVDGYGERPVMLVGLGGLGVGALAIAAAPSFPVVLLAAFALGAFYATTMPGTNKAILSSVPEDERNLAMGIKQVGVTAGSGTAALLVPGLASVAVLSWHAGFVVAGAAALVVTAAFALLYVGSGGTGTLAWPDLRGLWDNRAYVALVFAGLFLGAAMFSTAGYTILYLEESVGMAVTTAGGVLAAMQVAGSAGRVLVGGLTDRLPWPGAQSAARVVLAQAVAMCVLFVVVSALDSKPLAAAGFVLLGFFLFGFTGMFYSCMGMLVDADELGGASAGGQLLVNVGALLAPPAFGYVADHLGYRPSWLLLAGLTFAGVVLLVGVERRAAAL